MILGRISSVAALAAATSMMLSVVLFGRPITTISNLAVIGLAVFVGGTATISIMADTVTSTQRLRRCLPAAVLMAVFGIGYFTQPTLNGTPVAPFTSSARVLTTLGTIDNAFSAADTAASWAAQDPVLVRSDPDRVLSDATTADRAAAELLRVGHDTLNVEPLTHMLTAAADAARAAHAAALQNEPGRSDTLNVAINAFTATRSTAVNTVDGWVSAHTSSTWEELR